MPTQTFEQEAKLVRVAVSEMHRQGVRVTPEHVELAVHAAAAVPDGAVPISAPNASPEMIRVWLIAQLKAAGKPTGWLERSATGANAATPDLRTALTRLWDQLLKLRAHVDDWAAANGKRFVETDGPAVQQFAEPTPWGSPWDRSTNAADAYPEDTKNPIGNPHGDERIVRRRRATDVERDIRIARKRARSGGSIDDQEKWNQELAQLNAELEAIRAAERGERDELKRF